MATAKSQQKRLATQRAAPRPVPAPPPAAAPEEQKIAEAGLPEIMTKAELDAQHDIALREPRSLTQFQADASELVTLNEETAAACVYSLPFRDAATGTTQMVRGASARFAEILQHCFRNCRVGGFLLQETATDVVARGMFIDLERNNTRATDVPRRIVNKHGQRYSRDVIARTASAAIAIAKRNAVLEGIPQALWQPIYQKALRVIAGDSSTLAANRKVALDYLAKQGVPAAAVFSTLGVQGLEDIGLEELTTLRGLANAIKDGEVSIEEAFFPKPAPATGTAAARESLAASSSSTHTPAAQELPGNEAT